MKAILFMEKELRFAEDWEEVEGNRLLKTVEYEREPGFILIFEDSTAVYPLRFLALTADSSYDCASMTVGNVPRDSSEMLNSMSDEVIALLTRIGAAEIADYRERLKREELAEWERRREESERSELERLKKKYGGA